ncbi:MAG: hypothetical protein AUK48_09340 [Oscillatoriales cyanobacterium CG2_30_44_21]|nr:MAG: hypothetical protein AUK48_09340 [Oscillatoriales cyanobacterium CG2_30_44_21]
MERADIFAAKTLTIELSSQIYEALIAEVKATGKTESQLVEQGLENIFKLSGDRLTSLDQLSIIETTLEIKLKQYIDKLFAEQQLAPAQLKPNPTIESPSDRALDLFPQKIMPLPTIRALQVGDRVLVLEPDSPYYMAKLLVVRTSLIRATVETDTGEKTFLKRDLRFVNSES